MKYRPLAMLAKIALLHGPWFSYATGTAGLVYIACRYRKRKTSLSISRQYTNIFIFRFVSEHCLRSTLRLFHYIWISMAMILKVGWPNLNSLRITVAHTQSKIRNTPQHKIHTTQNTFRNTAQHISPENIRYTKHESYFVQCLRTAELL